MDPTVEHDIYSDKPWALSPTMATMNFLSISETPASDSNGSKAERKSAPVIEEDVAVEGIAHGDVQARRRFFADKEKRKGVSLKGREVGMEFANGLLGE